MPSYKITVVSSDGSMLEVVPVQRKPKFGSLPKAHLKLSPASRQMLYARLLLAKRVSGDNSAFTFSQLAIGYVFSYENKPREGAINENTFPDKVVQRCIVDMHSDLEKRLKGKQTTSSLPSKAELTVTLIGKFTQRLSR